MFQVLHQYSITCGFDTRLSSPFLRPGGTDVIVPKLSFQRSIELMLMSRCLLSSPSKIRSAQFGSRNLIFSPLKLKKAQLCSRHLFSCPRNLHRSCDDLTVVVWKLLVFSMMIYCGQIAGIALGFYSFPLPFFPHLAQYNLQALKQSWAIDKCQME